ncbi:hypothetical protein [Brachyspira hyodysenteriae]|uniref:hypothetical protein n=2 Tax=Brachyspira hyodysenteriae TaxID=159 RepID=UPI000A168900|nr:hypothetical protein [Brachyspira hyodysenteriae]TVL44662.1 hypothetical protein A9X73_11570 [Brachyspira hyodysenteriae]
MPRSTLLYKLLISCPSDIENEINIIKNAIQNFNKTLGDAKNIKIETLYWKDDVVPQMGEDGQSIINNQIVKEADAIIAIFGEKLGSPTPRYESGTIEEIEEMLKAKKQVFLYFSNKPIDRRIRDSEEFYKIEKFKEKYGSKGIYAEYKDDDDFKEKVNMYIFKYFANMDKYNNITSNSKKITIKSYNNGLLKDTLEYHEMINNSYSIINSEKEKIIKLIEEIKSIDLGMPLNFCNGLVSSLNYIENWYLVQTFSFQNNIDIDINNFFNLGYYNPNKSYFGTEWTNIMTGQREILYPTFENEEKKYKLINKLIIHIDFYNKIKESIEYLSKLKCLSLAVVNENCQYDENIEVCITIPKKHFIDKDYFNDDKKLDKINEIIFENIFKCKKTLENIIINCYDNQTKIKDNSIETINQLYDKYDIDINDNIINIMFEIKKLNSGSGIWFPSVLFFNEEIDEITYFITSKNSEKTEGIIKKEKQQ